MFGFTKKEKERKALTFRRENKKYEGMYLKFGNTIMLYRGIHKDSDGVYKVKFATVDDIKGIFSLLSLTGFRINYGTNFEEARQNYAVFKTSLDSFLRNHPEF